MATNPLRAVLDTNVIVAAFKSKNPASPTAELLERWQNGEFVLIYSAELEAEYREKLVAKRIELPRRVEFLLDLQGKGEYIEVAPEQIKPVIAADPDDDIVLACAVVGRASHLVTYDSHILDLGDAYQGVALVNALQFLYLVRGETHES